MLFINAMIGKTKATSSFNRLAVCTTAVVDGAFIVIKRNEIACVKNRKASNGTLYPSKGDHLAWPEIPFL